LCDREFQTVCGSWFKCWVWAFFEGKRFGEVLDIEGLIAYKEQQVCNSIPADLGHRELRSGKISAPLIISPV
jgi:hypothetical protein